MGFGRKAALAGLTALALSAAIVAPAQAARYFATAEVQLGNGNSTSVDGYGKRLWIPSITYPGGIFSHGGFRDASYSAPARVSRRGIFGSLGRFGTVDLRFEPQGKPRRYPRPRTCHGGPDSRVEWRGTFHGTVRFTPEPGQHGFTHDGALKGAVQSIPAWKCEFQEGERPFDPTAGGINVNAYNCDERDFQATVEVHPADPPPPPGDGPWDTASFTGSWTKRVGVASIGYTIGVEGGPQTATFNDDLSEGTVEPPPPFHGSATIRTQGEGWVWSGDLTAHFPGRTVSLTGSGFEPLVSTFEPRPNTSFEFAEEVRC